MNIVNKLEKPQRIYFLLRCVVAFLIALVLSHSLFAQLFLTPRASTKVEIVDTAVKNEDSFGTDVRIQSIQVDGNLISFEELDFDPAWSIFDEILGAVNPKQPAKAVYEAKDAEQMALLFQKQEGSGVVEIYVDGKLKETVDLYSAEWSNVMVRVNLGVVSALHHPVLFLLLYAALLGASLCVRTVLDLVKVDSRTKRFTGILLLLYGAIWIGWLGFGVRENVIYRHSLFILFFVLIWLFTIKLHEAGKQRKSIVVLSQILVYIVSSVILCWAVERINGNVENLSRVYFLGNIVIYMALVLIIDILVRRTALTVVISTCLTIIYAAGNYYVTLFRGSPIVPGDFFVLNTARNVAGNYQYSITWEMFYVTILLIAWVAAVHYLYQMRKNLDRGTILFDVVLAAVIIGCVGKLDFYNPALDLWNLNANVETYGIAISMASNIRQMRAAPSGRYSVQAVRKLYEEYQDDSLQEELRQPNVIVIMNESFSDLSVVSDAIDSNEIMPYFNSIEENSVRGKAYVSTIGGGTANTEWEMLTGNTMAFVRGSVPYQQYILKESNSIAWTFRQRGYYTAAIHPYYRDGYNRTIVYPRLGFHDFLDIESFENPQLSRDRYITDEESYKKVIEIFEKSREQGQKAFIFNVTMQNHSGYTTGYWGDQVIRVPGYEGEFPDVEEYLTLIKQSDDAFPVLIDYFSSIDDPTVILIFGDHQPKVEDDFYETMKGKNLSDWTLEEAQQRYEVPFLVWANYDIEEKKDVVTSANYLSTVLFEAAGIPMIPYQRFHKSLEELVPAINMNGYLGSDGQWYDYNTDSMYQTYLDEYWNIQYNNMFDQNKVMEWFEAAS